MIKLFSVKVTPFGRPLTCMLALATCGVASSSASQHASSLSNAPVHPSHRLKAQTFTTDGIQR